MAALHLTCAVQAKHLACAVHAKHASLMPPLPQLPNNMFALFKLINSASTPIGVPKQKMGFRQEQDNLLLLGNNYRCTGAGETQQQRHMQPVYVVQWMVRMIP